MATCPHCGQYLGRDHQCRGLWRLRLRAWLTVTVGGTIGAAAFALVSVALHGAASELAILAGVLLGGLVTFAYLRGEP
jgi:hypothetical protein